MYLYMRLILERRLPRRWILCFLPTMLMIIISQYALFAVLQPFSFQKYLGTIYHHVVLLAITVSYLVYGYLYITTVRAYQGKESHKKEILDWLKLLFIVFFLKALIAAFFLMNTLFSPSTRTLLNPILALMVVMIEAVILLIASIYAFKEPQLLQMDRIDLFNITHSKKQKIKMSEEEVSQFKEKLRRVVSEEKIYKRWDLNERALADALGMQPYLMSIFLNEFMGQSFNEYINAKRVEEAQRLLLDPKTMDDKMYSIALESGYNSESVFYTNFKKFTGYTPRQFQKIKLAE
jgi:YesN/AraC family two-component response regulator